MVVQKDFTKHIYIYIGALGRTVKPASMDRLYSSAVDFDLALWLVQRCSGIKS